MSCHGRVTWLPRSCHSPLWIWCHPPKGIRHEEACECWCGCRKLGSAPRLSAVRAGQVSEVRAVAVRPNELGAKCIRSLIVSVSRGNFYSPSVSLLNRVRVASPATLALWVTRPAYNAQQTNRLWSLTRRVSHCTASFYRLRFIMFGWVKNNLSYYYYGPPKVQPAAQQEVRTILYIPIVYFNISNRLTIPTRTNYSPVNFHTLLLYLPNAKYLCIFKHMLEIFDIQYIPSYRFFTLFE